MKGVSFNGFYLFLLFFFTLFMSLSSISALSQSGSDLPPVKFIIGGEENLGPWKYEMSQMTHMGPAPGPNGEDTLVLAANRTKRPDILRGFRRYRGGWDITDRHYWASVGFTGAAGFILAVLWFISFGLALGIHLCCGWGISIKHKESNRSQRICLILLISFTFAVATGCILLSVGQDKFHGEALGTLQYVVNQSDYTVQTLRNVTEYLSLAKTINVNQIPLPSDVMDDIDKLNVDLNTAANTLSEKTEENSVKVRRVFDAVRLALIVVAAVMLLLAVIGLLLSILGHQHAILIFVISGWLLAATTFILCGMFMIINNAISDTCMAMGEWVENPHTESALSDILPCVDQRTTNKTLFQSKQVVNNIANVVNQFIYSTANINATKGSPYYYNQSGPGMPSLCYPFDPQYQERQCTAQEVSSANASMVWKNYECEVSESGICTTVGRVTPAIYSQLVAAVNESYALEHYTPLLLNLQNCNFVRDAFAGITTSYCPPLTHYLKIVNAGLGLISVGVLLCLVLWLLYANRPGKGDVFGKLSLSEKLKSRFSKNRNSTNPSLSNAGSEV
ncbi:hypothetical protein HN51_029380 [Arachis hypogaea]|uniref:uncharacterized protein n=1 Tax=Arachis hypogaea TaxID=3818 RepID=UPI000DECB738|nr:uncharacterized protein LOC112711995 [Arachis hypogaea]QHO35999.1 Transmembrane protein, putative [Arachis hypogaea]